MTTAASGTTQWAKNRYGQRILIDPTDFIGQKVLRNTIYDLETLLLLEDLFGRLKPEVILDIGANIGNHTLMFSRFAHKVLSFEPGARAFSMLSQNLQANGLNHVQPFQIGLSDSDTVQTLYVETSGNLGGSSLVRTNMDTQNHEEDIITLKIGDAVLHEQPPGAIDFIKIDVEGHEHAVIRGLRHTISRHRPVILMEWEQDKGWLLEEHARPSILSEYLFYPLIWNTSTDYWKRQPMGWVRRNWLRVTGTKQRVPCPLAISRTFSRVSDILLVPKEKEALVDSLVFR
ncbi:MAG: FkbM family methyltransferase [Alcaligenaceae bacterium]|nr:FkbM family methyltransferase [Alcaligenaceae bacterium]